MSGIYIHIPFCKQACHYCDFHFSTTMKTKTDMVAAICQELRMRVSELKGLPITTIYFGGGTPSLLTLSELKLIFDTVYTHYTVQADAEVTLEANPDDLNAQNIAAFATTPINRLSIGIQSFFEEDLRIMNRAHTHTEAKQCITLAQRYFSNISIDLIYGIPKMSTQRWKENLNIALSYDIPHISSYALTVEPKTALEKLIYKGTIPPVKDTLAREHFDVLTTTLTSAGFMHYELSNFGKSSYFSKNNTAYWQGKPYLGIGPSAHSYHTQERSWNIAHNYKYIRAIQNKKRPHEIETLTLTDQYNEYMMTGLRTMWGVSLEKVTTDFGIEYENYLLKQAQKHIDAELLTCNGTTLLTTEKGKFLCDGIASDLFFVH